jgi:CRP/FNR family cyclic AMP-dependent transcriptional regulator
MISIMKRKFLLSGIKEVLLAPLKVDRKDSSLPMRALFGLLPKSSAGQGGQDIVGFLSQVQIFEDLGRGDLRRLARLAHERSYGDGEYIYEQGKPGVAMFIVRTGTVEILRRAGNGEEIPLAVLQPPASLGELELMGGESIRWHSARARGPVSMVSLGRSDVEALSHNFPLLANKILTKLAQITALRLEMLIEAEYFPSEQAESEP